ncbi:MAG: precorrin-3B C(17)-methyltransferase [Candidatus Methanoplasma sp.]|jgi:precorrin-3B C17-methyltransferase|nr:precorrin-3B C(17)-methyltransferase [Candidatus Methanoplasma sp.]
MSGKLSVVGFGPGSREDMTLRAVNAILDADLIVGYTTYIDILKAYFPDKKYKNTGMTGEIDRCRTAVKDAVSGLSVAIVSSGDSGIYGMAGIVYQVAEELGADVPIDVIPGITAASSAASLLGAPLMHDTAIISLSDLLTPFDLIMKRVDCAGVGDMIVALYNPKSNTRTEHLSKALDVLLKYRSPETPVGIVRNAGRADEKVTITTLGGLNDADVDMFCTVIIGNSQTYASQGKMITPRGYRI